MELKARDNFENESFYHLRKASVHPRLGTKASRIELQTEKLFRKHSGIIEISGKGLQLLSISIKVIRSYQPSFL